MGNMLKSPPSMKQSHGSSMPQHTAVGSGSRPTAGKTDTPVSSPKDAHGLDGRKTPGALGC